MENAARALEMAAGVLLAVLLMAAVSYFFSNISDMPTQEDELMEAEQLSKFNLEYEVFQKNAMYGVDVISCLNKAKSNNEKYVEGDFLAGVAYGDKYKIEVCVRIDSPLEETMEIFYYESFDPATKLPVHKLKPLYDFSTNIISMRDAGFFNKNVLNANNTYTNYTPDMDIVEAAEMYEKLDTNGKHIIPGGGSTKFKNPSDGVEYNYYSLQKDKELIALLEFTDTMKITKNNLDDSTKDKWSYAVWTTAAYNLKTKKFKCDYLGYNEETGRVNTIYFSEL